MRRLAVLLVLLGSACGSDPDTRPATADYIITAILEPNCGRAACHDSASKAKDIELDTIDSALASLRGSSGKHGPMVSPCDPQGSRLYTVMWDTSSPMPPDQPVPTADIALIERWIENGAPGVATTSCP